MVSLNIHTHMYKIIIDLNYFYLSLIFEFEPSESLNFSFKPFNMKRSAKRIGRNERKKMIRMQGLIAEINLRFSHI